MLCKKRYLSVFTIGFALLLLAACGGGAKLSDEGNNVSQQDWIVEDFSATNESDKPMALSDLKGEVWLADFVFTNCTTVCGPMSANMSKIQQKLEDEDVKIPIVSFSVDPKTDSPDVLKEYAERFGADLATWHFLTGYSFEEVQKLSVDSFKSPLEKPLEGDDQYMHGVLFYLVQGDKIIKTYNGAQHTPIDAIVDDVKVLLKEEA